MKNKSGLIDKLFMGGIAVVAFVQCVLLLVPLMWVLFASFNDYYSYIMNPFSLPKSLEFSNYATAFKNLQIEIWSSSKQARIQYSIFSMFGYSLIISAVSSFMGVFISAIISYVTAKYKFRFGKILYNFNLFTMILPIVGSLPSQLAVYKMLGLYDNLLPFLLVGYTGLGFNFLLFYGAFKSLPIEYKEAGVIDGAGHFSIMFKIYFPLVVPLFVAVFILAFMGAWNNYMINVIWLPSYPNLAYGVYMFEYKSKLMGYSIPEVLAGFIIVAIPSALIWILSQRVIGKGLVVGGLKG